uniref:Uncharacterized protein n=1 Tax=viral metagenome TaxID=1070528 RepID=A0A6C0LN05_9ZZZZ
MTSNFCIACEKILIFKYDTGSVIKYCDRCKREYQESAEDTLIDSSFSNVEGYNNESILKFAPFDRVNQLVKYDCPTEGCGRKYMTKVFLDTRVWYVCNNCPIRLQGRDVNINTV